jgi:hypothetical protein
MILTDALILGQFCVILGVLLLMQRSIMILVAQLLEEIDHRVAAAIKSVVEDLQIEGLEPPNPIQQLLFGVLQDRMSSGSPGKTPRDLKGQFANVIEIDDRD